MLTGPGQAAVVLVHGASGQPAGSAPRVRNKQDFFFIFFLQGQCHEIFTPIPLFHDSNTLAEAFLDIGFDFAEICHVKNINYS